MNQNIRIACAQINLTVGDIHHNAELIQKTAFHARDELKADIIIFPEMTLSGYPADDLWELPHFIKQCEDTVSNIVNHISGIYCVFGYPKIHQQQLLNCCGIYYNNNCLGEYFKQCLPNQGVFDDKRYFTAGKKTCVIHIRNAVIGFLICEDIWLEEPMRSVAHHGANMVISINASPYEKNKFQKRFNLIKHHAQKYHLPIVYVNQVGGQDDLIFDGQSFAVNAQGELVAKAETAQETILCLDLKIHPQHCEILHPSMQFIQNEIKEMYALLVLSIKDYFNKNHFTHTVIGLSGGIDSALVLTLAVDALGKDKVHALILPTQFSAPESVMDAKALASNLNVSFQEISIDYLFNEYKNMFAEYFQTPELHLVNENIQARIRGNILMAYANQNNALLFSTGNRSELAVGYCTLYGDMAGGFAPIKDIFKTEVYDLVHYRNQIGAVIPNRMIEREPSAELAPNQKDSDSLPPYPVLDSLLKAHLEDHLDQDGLIALGFNKKIVKHVLNLVKKNEYKRRQAPVGPHFHLNSFTRARRFPITNGFEEK